MKMLFVFLSNMIIVSLIIFPCGKEMNSIAEDVHSVCFNIEGGKYSQKKLQS